MFQVQRAIDIIDEGRYCSRLLSKNSTNWRPWRHDDQLEISARGPGVPPGYLISPGTGFELVTVGCTVRTAQLQIVKCPGLCPVCTVAPAVLKPGRIHPRLGYRARLCFRRMPSAEGVRAEILNCRF
jgi:hypothetical protein